MSETDITILAEHQIEASLATQLSALLEESFPGTFQGRTYFKQLPHLRLLAHQMGALVGQLGIDCRIISVGGTVLNIFGIIDLCVRTDRRGRGIASALLAEAEGVASRAGRDFLVLMTDRHQFYERNGFQRVQPASTKLLAIEDRQSAALIEKDLSECFMIKPLHGKTWPHGQIDMLGYLF